MAAGIIVRIGVKAKNLAAGLRKAMKSIERWSRGIRRMGRSIGQGLITGMRTAIVGGIGLVSAAVAKGLSESGRFEKFELQFEALLGSAKAAKDRMEEMKRLDLEVPFDITDLMDGSRILTVFTENAHAGIDAMRRMADAASVTPNSIKDVAFWYGRAYSMIQSGRPFGEAAMRLQEMGLLTGKARNEMEALGKSGSSVGNIEVMLSILDAELDKFGGSAIKLSKTWTGLWSIFTSASKQAFAAFGDGIMPLAKVWLKQFTDKITKLRTSGDLKTWGRTLGGVLSSFRTAIEKSVPKIQTLIDKFGELKSYISKEKWNVVGDNIAAGLSNAIPAINKAFAALLPVFTDWGIRLGLEILKGITLGIPKGIGNAIGDSIGYSKEQLRKLNAETRLESEIKRNSGDINLAKNILNAKGVDIGSTQMTPQWAKGIISRNKSLANSLVGGPQQVIITENRDKDSKQADGAG